MKAADAGHGRVRDQGVLEDAAALEGSDARVGFVGPSVFEIVDSMVRLDDFQPLSQRCSWMSDSAG